MRRLLEKKLFVFVLGAFFLTINQTAPAFQKPEKAKMEAGSDVKSEHITFTYQGELKDGNGPVNGSYDLKFTVYSTQAGGTPLGSVMQDHQALMNGMFSLKLDFDRAVLNAPEGWLEVAVRPSGSTEEYGALFPRQKLTPVPSAILAKHEQWSLIGVPVGVADRETIQGGPNTPKAAIAVPQVKDDTSMASSQLASSPAGVEWTRDAFGNLYPTNLGDRVGIGISSPRGKLDVNGSSRFQDVEMHGQVEFWGGPFIFRRKTTDESPGAGVIQITSAGELRTGDMRVQGDILGNLNVKGTVAAQVLQITGADIAEPFNVTDTDTIQSGTVVAIDPKQPGRLRTADKAYDSTVAGIISGANGINTAIIMKQEGTLADGSHMVALSGRVYCWADASYGQIKPGDMLTTSDTPGHAMKASDHKKAQGAIIGKAMTELKHGKGLVLTLVTLQ